MHRVSSGQERRDAWLGIGLWACAALAASIVVSIAGFLCVEAWPAWREIGVSRFASDASWHPAEGRFQLSAMFVATLVSSAGALALATPLGILCALYCRWVAPPALATGVRRVVELLAGVPSVVYGFWGLVTLVPWLATWQAPGSNLLAGMLILAAMILPTVALLSDVALARVPREFLLGGAALGLSRFALLRRVVLPAAGPGIATGVLLAAGRALGETMAVLMVCGNVVQLPHSLFDPVRTLTANIALEMGYAAGVHQSALFVAGLVLLLLVTGLVLAAEALSPRRIRPGAWNV